MCGGTERVGEEDLVTVDLHHGHKDAHVAAEDVTLVNGREDVVRGEEVEPGLPGLGRAEHGERLARAGLPEREARAHAALEHKLHERAGRLGVDPHVVRLVAVREVEAERVVLRVLCEVYLLLRLRDKHLEAVLHLHNVHLHARAPRNRTVPTCCKLPRASRSTQLRPTLLLLLYPGAARVGCTPRSTSLGASEQCTSRDPWPRWCLQRSAAVFPCQDACSCNTERRAMSVPTLSCATSRRLLQTPGAAAAPEKQSKHFGVQSLLQFLQGGSQGVRVRLDTSETRQPSAGERRRETRC